MRKEPGQGQSFINGYIETPAGRIPRATPQLTAADIVGHWRVRWGIGRDDFKVDPGLYAIGDPTPESPVLVTANYKLTFDIVRSKISGLNAWVLVLDTRGINVWCAAGKRTFSTDEVIGRVEFDRLADVVNHRRIILPQLGAPGVAAHEVKKATGFTVIYGPVRVADVPAFIEAGMRATDAMRTPTFNLRDRVILTPVELVGARKVLASAILFFAIVTLIFTRPLTAGDFLINFLRNITPFAVGLISGAVVTPILLPWLPFRQFAAKGALTGIALGAATALAFGQNIIGGAAIILIVTAMSSYAAMNFTGSTPFTSLSGVEHEMRRWLPVQAATAVLAILMVAAKGVLG